MDALRILSLGAGVQSTTLYLMAKEGLVEADCAIFSDTRWEPPAVYRHLDWLSAQGGPPIHRVGRGDLRADALDPGHRFASMPLFVLNLDGTRGMLRRQCTSEYKLKPIQQRARELGASRRRPTTMLIGFSLDEVERMADSRVLYLRNDYPLADARMTRHDCEVWLAARGYPRPPRSACIGCPLHSDRIWREMRDERPLDWAEAVAFDAEIRHRRPHLGPLYLHPQLVALDRVDLSTAEDRGQLPLLDLGSCSPFGCRPLIQVAR